MTVIRHRFLVALLAALSMGPAATAGQPAPKFGSRPRYLHTAEEIAAWKADAARAGEISEAVARGDAALAANLTLPKESGQWIFYYNCPKDNTRLQAENPQKHVCPSCKAVYEDERTRAAWRTSIHNQIDKQAEDLGLAYALTGDAKYAAPLRKILLELADLYPKWEHHDRWGRTGMLAVVGGWRYCQLLDEAYSLILLATAYDLIADAPDWTPADRKRVEDGLLRKVADQIGSFEKFVDAKVNHQTWFNGAYAVAGLAAGDAGLLTKALDDPKRGLLWQLKNSVTDDGIWYEGTMAYHFYALEAVEHAALAARRAGRDLTKDARLRSLWFGPLQMAYPDGRMPVFNDSDPVSLRTYDRHYRWAAKFFGDEKLASLTGTSDAAVPSAVLKDIGIAVLRRGAGPQATCAMVDYGTHGGSHGHPDKLGFVLFAQGTEWALDPGRISYSVPEYKSWSRTTVAHNTVVIGGKDQEETTGELLYFGEAEDHAACLAVSDKAYPGFRLKRLTALGEGFLADVFAVEGAGKPAAIDWLLHVRGEPAADGKEESGIRFDACAESLGKADGYGHLKVTGKVAGSPESAVWALTQGGGRLRVFLVDDKASTVYTGTGIGYQVGDAVPFLLRRRQGKAAVFVTLIETDPKAGIRSVRIAGARGPARIALEVEREGGKKTIELDWSRAKAAPKSASPVKIR